MLWRALNHVTSGFYIDVCAAWPVEHSVTKAFYDRGWRGINIEPNPVHYASLVKQRPRDINLQLAMGERADQLTMNLLGDTGLSTLDMAIADQNKQGGKGIVQQIVSVDTLASVCSRNLPPGQEIHFLKVDAKGFEEQALRGNNWTDFRPWIVLVESTLPMTQQESHENWEPILLGADYFFAHADGLNRYYISKEHAYLAQKLKYPPNVFDGLLLIEQQRSEIKAQQAKVTSLAYKSQLDAVYNSNSWRITAPLSWLVQRLRLIRVHGLGKSVKALAQKVLRMFVLSVFKNHKLKRIATEVAYKLGIFERLKPLVHRLFVPQHVHLNQPSIYAASTGLQTLTPRARYFYLQLNQTKKENQKGDE